MVPEPNFVAGTKSRRLIWLIQNKHGLLIQCEQLINIEKIANCKGGMSATKPTLIII